MGKLTYFELGRTLYEARVREVWGFDKEAVKVRLKQYPKALVTDTVTLPAEVANAMAQAKAVLRTYTVSTKAKSNGGQQRSAAAAAPELDRQGPVDGSGLGEPAHCSDPAGCAENPTGRDEDSVLCGSATPVL